MFRLTLRAPRGAAAEPCRAVVRISTTAPVAPPPTDEQIAALVCTFHDSKRLVTITGAGCSTESGVPDYRSPNGAYSTGFKPMTHQQFLASAANRARYWARSFYGWSRFAATQPNAAHLALADLEHRGWLAGLVTQNVDRLHSRAGSRHVLELHGTSHEVICLGCGWRCPRQAVQEVLAALNPGAAEHVAALMAGPRDEAAERQQVLRVGSARDDIRVAASCTAPPPPLSSSGAPSSQPLAASHHHHHHQHQRHHHHPPPPTTPVPPPLTQRPDGDVELADAGTGFLVPPCEVCGGVLKPDVVFFGDNIPQQRKDRAAALTASTDTLLVAGSSVQVFSAYRLVEAAKKAGARVVIVNVGPTRADKLADLKVEARVGEVLSRLARHPELQLPKLQ